ncbi:MAG: hypothetical protein QXS52_03525, partial [Thermoplasmata archaeon]
VKNNLKILGTIINIKKDTLIAKSIKPPKMNEEVFDYKGNLVGYIINIFGPVKSPYFRVKLKKNTEIKGYVFGGEKYVRGKEKGEKGMDR